MPTDRKPRIAITPDALRALKVWAALEDVDPGALAARLILTHMPARVRDVLRDSSPPPSEGCGAVPAKKRFISDDPAAISKIKEMYGRASVRTIAKEIGRPPATVGENIKKMKERGELG